MADAGTGVVTVYYCCCCCFSALSAAGIADVAAAAGGSKAADDAGTLGHNLAADAGRNSPVDDEVDCIDRNIPAAPGRTLAGHLPSFRELPAAAAAAGHTAAEVVLAVLDQA